MIKKCLVCGKNFRVNADKKGRYDKGHYFGDFKAPVDGMGKYKKVGTTKFAGKKFDVVKWTGKEKNVEYWECNECFQEAEYMAWLEEIVEKLYGNRCKDYAHGCSCCQAWDVYDTIREHFKGSL